MKLTLASLNINWYIPFLPFLPPLLGSVYVLIMLIKPPCVARKSVGLRYSNSWLYGRGTSMFIWNKALWNDFKLFQVVVPFWFPKHKQWNMKRGTSMFIWNKALWNDFKLFQVVVPFWFPKHKQWNMKCFFTFYIRYLYEFRFTKTNKGG